MKTLIIYYNETKTSYQVIKPSDKFIQDWKGLVNNITGSDDNCQKYYSYEVI